MINRRRRSQNKDFLLANGEEYMLLKILFIFYYGKLRLRVLFGAHQTSRPLGIKWRWNHWIYNFQERSNRLF